MTLEELLQERNIPFRKSGEHHHAREGWLNLDCPYCSPGTNRFRLGYNINFHYSNCWSCGPHPLHEVLQEILGLSRKETYQLFRIEKTYREKSNPNAKLLIPTSVGGLQRAHKSYLQKRGFDPENIIQLWGVRGIAISNSLQWRLFIPIICAGQMVSWTTRSIARDAQRRYVSARIDQEKLPHKQLLYGQDFCRHACIVHEGPLDVWRTGPGAVCTFGTVYSVQQIEKIAKFPVRAITFDVEPTAQMAARNLCRILKNYPGETHLVTLTTGKDAAEASKYEIKELRRRFLE